MGYRECFTKQARDYARYRPDYPPELFAFLAGLAPAKNLAWDCACGSGQAAKGLAPYFKQVLASDATEAQIREASGPANVSFKVANAEAAPLENQSVDLVCVAQAVHWFDLELFYKEVLRVLKPGGVIALWGYGFGRINPQLDALINEFSLGVLGPYWSERNRLLIDAYRLLPFPFQRLHLPELKMQKAMNFEDLKGLLRSWSAYQLFLEKEKRDPFESFEEKVLALWGKPGDKKTMHWDLTLLVGRV